MSKVGESQNTVGESQTNRSQGDNTADGNTIDKQLQKLGIHSDILRKFIAPDCPGICTDLEEGAIALYFIAYTLSLLTCLP